MSVDFAFLDSGTGGLPYLKYLKDRRPDSTCVYVGDTKNFPYGEKSSEEITEKSCECVEKIIEKFSPHTVIIACNTISVTALDVMRERFPETPFVGTVPAIKPAAKISKTRKIGLLATNATVNHPYTKKLISDFASDCTVFSRGDPDLISFIEHGYTLASDEERVEACRASCDFFKEKGCDVIVLACTHFLRMPEYIQKAAGPSVSVVDSREGVVRHALEVERNSTAGMSDRNALGLKGGGSCGKKDGSRLYVTALKTPLDRKTFEEFSSMNGMTFGGLLGEP